MGYDDDYYSGMAEIAAEEYLEQQRIEEEESYYITLLGFGDECEVLVDIPHNTKEEAIKEAKTYKGKAKTAKIYKGRPIGFD